MEVIAELVAKLPEMEIDGVMSEEMKAMVREKRMPDLGPAERLAEYKPLAKIEELEEQNYNMIDNVLNNGAGEKEQEHIQTRASVREKLAEKREVTRQKEKGRKPVPEKDADKKAERGR
jgi:hypothetical protein